MCTIIHIPKALLCPLFPSPVTSRPPLLLPCRPSLLICSSHEGRTARCLKDTWRRWVQHMLLCSTACEISMETVQLKI